MPKNSPEVVSKPIFFSENEPFLLLFAIICIQMACFKKVKELRGVCWYQWFNTCIEECPALVSPAQVFNLLRNGQNAP